MSSTQSEPGRTSAPPLVSQSPPHARPIPLDAPWTWLEAGWDDLRSMPHISLIYGGAFTAAAIVIALGLTRHAEQSLFLPLAGGFLLLGPFVAAGLYDASRRRAQGESPRLRTVIAAPFTAAGQLPFLGVILLMIFFAWLQLAFLLVMLFLGTQVPPTISDMVGTMLLTPRGLGLLVVGSAIGGVLAALVFTISAFSAPMLLDRPVDAVSAARASAQVVRRNIGPMLLWAALIAAIMVAGFAMLLVGLVVAFPLCAHATWHAYADVFGAAADEGQAQA